MSSGRRLSAPRDPAPVVEDSPRLRFAKREIVKILTALEQVSASDLDAGMRVLQLEDKLADLLEDCRRWRRAYEVAHRLLLANGDERIQQLDEALREWVGQA